MIFEVVREFRVNFQSKGVKNAVRRSLRKSNFRSRPGFLTAELLDFRQAIQAARAELLETPPAKGITLRRDVAGSFAAALPGTSVGAALIPFGSTYDSAQEHLFEMCLVFSVCCGLLLGLKVTRCRRRGCFQSVIVASVSVNGISSSVLMGTLRFLGKIDLEARNTRPGFGFRALVLSVGVNMLYGERGALHGLAARCTAKKRLLLVMRCQKGQQCQKPAGATCHGINDGNTRKEAYVSDAVGVDAGAGGMCCKSWSLDLRERELPLSEDIPEDRLRS
ncbi:unnamed protein product [Notodromas monacha]|uniref:Uncharacterized protein n=1 Tax=Notodromas monacha TaxID=399045 RepID=A0A7R9BR08_9CRUS|nr:unnamed protein product [Notodromas monacha]CAG0918740.1 unnamed protein product [Notodromas monacha]